MAVNGSGFARWIRVTNAVACGVHASVESVLVPDVLRSCMAWKLLDGSSSGAKNFLPLTLEGKLVFASGCRGSSMIQL